MKKSKQKYRWKLQSTRTTVLDTKTTPFLERMAVKTWRRYRYGRDPGSKGYHSFLLTEAQLDFMYWVATECWNTDGLYEGEVMDHYYKIVTKRL